MVGAAKPLTLPARTEMGALLGRQTSTSVCIDRGGLRMPASLPGPWVPALLCSAPSYLHCWWSQYCEQCINVQIAASRQIANAQRGCRYQRSEFSITLFVKTASVNFELLNCSHNPSSFPFQAALPLTHRFPSRFCSALTSGGCASICSHFAPPPPSTPLRRWKLWQVLGEWYRDYFSSC